MYSFLTADYFPDYKQQRIMGESFIRFIDLCFEQALYFSLSIAPWTTCTKNDFKEALEPYLVKRIEARHWFGYPSVVRSKKVQIYHAHPETKAIILKFLDEIFFEKEVEGKWVESTDTLEDLCFFTRTTLLVGTVTHEGILMVNPCFTAMVHELDTFGKWKYFEEESLDFPYITELNLE